MSFRIPKKCSCEWKTEALFMGALAIILTGYLLFAYWITR